MWGSARVRTEAELDLAVGFFRDRFGACLSEMCLRPRLAALGLSPPGFLGELLVKHGVEISEVPARVQTITQQLGADVVQQALGATNPWQELKWHANQLRPPLMLII